jgi:integrase
LVNADRVKRKLPSLLVDSSTTKPKGWNSLMRYRYRYNRFKKKNPEKTISMVNSLPKKYVPYIFNPNVDSSRTNMCYLKRKVAKSQNTPRFLQIHFHTFRHYFATEKLRQTKMLTHVQYLLGHKKHHQHRTLCSSSRLCR